MSVSITNWFGRLGNNIIQLTSALSYCEKNSSDLKIPQHSVFTKTKINLNGQNNTSYSDVFWTYYESDDERRRLGRKYILPIINPKKIDLSPDDLVIHLRGGDIFIGNPPKNYVQAPTSYIKKIIELQNPKKIIVVYEDNTNPNLNFLIQNYDNVTLVNDLFEGISYILSTKTMVITGVGTFARSLMMCSDNVEKIYVPSFLVNNNMNNIYDHDCCIDFSDLEVIKIEIKNYLTTNTWGWNEDIKNLFITHKL